MEVIADFYENDRGEESLIKLKEIQQETENKDVEVVRIAKSFKKFCYKNR